MSLTNKESFDLVKTVSEIGVREGRLAALREVREMVADLPIHYEPIEVCKFIAALIKREEEK